MTGNRPGLSVVIAATDSPRAVGRLLATIAGQGGGCLEVIVVGEAKVVARDGEGSAAPAEGQALAPRLSPEKGPTGSSPGVYPRMLVAPRSLPPLPNPPPPGGRGPEGALLPPSLLVDEGGINRERESLRIPSSPLVGEGRGEGARDSRARDDLENPRVRPGPTRRILAPAGSGVPRLRRLGLEAATGHVVVFTEDSCLAAPSWVDAWLAAFEDPSVVAASGVVEHDRGASALDWAVVFCEYAPFLPPGPGGPPSRLAGNNFAVDRGHALRLTEGGEVHETDLLAALLQGGGEVRTVDRAVVRHVRRFGAHEAFGDRIRFGLEYGRLRARRLPPLARVAGWVAGPAIFAAQVGRLLGAVLRTPRHLGPFARALPVTLAMLAAWSLGEWVGWSRASIERPRGQGPVTPPPARRRRGTAARRLSRRPGRSGSPPPDYKRGPT